MTNGDWVTDPQGVYKPLYPLTDIVIECIEAGHHHRVLLGKRELTEVRLREGKMCIGIHTESLRMRPLKGMVGHQVRVSGSWKRYHNSDPGDIVDADAKGYLKIWVEGTSQTVFAVETVEAWILG